MNKTKKDNLNWPEKIQNWPNGSELTEVKNIDISKDMLSYIITCRDRYPFFSDEMLQTWVEDRVRYAQQVLGEESEKDKQDSK